MKSTTYPTKAVRQSFALSYTTLKKDLTVHANYKLNNAETSEDLVQVTFMKTWAYLVKGGQIHLMRAFLYHVLNDLITDEYRKKKSVSLDALMDDGYEPTAAKDEEELLYAHFDAAAVIRLISKLPPKYQKIMYLRYVQNLTLTEMAAETGQSKNTLAVQSHRGLEKVKEIFRSEAKGTI